MNYQRVYLSIIENARGQSRSKGIGYHESHHIIPLGIGGADVQSNKILLTAKEHFICHHLLCKFTHGKDRAKMAFAFWAMCNQKTGDVKRFYRVNHRTYERAKIEFSKANSKLHKGKTLSPEHIEIIREQGKRVNKGKTGVLNPLYRRPRAQHVIDKIRKTKLDNPEGNAAFIGYYITPKGTFPCARLAGIANSMSKDMIWTRCKQPNKYTGWGFQAETSSHFPLTGLSSSVISSTSA